MFTVKHMLLELFSWTVNLDFPISSATMPRLILYQISKKNLDVPSYLHFYYKAWW